MAERAEFVGIEDMALMAAELHDNLMRQADPNAKSGELPKNVVFVTLSKTDTASADREASSIHQTMHIYRLANNLGANFDQHFVTPKQLEGMLSKGLLPSGEAQGKTPLHIVTVNDFLGSGSEAQGLMNRLNEMAKDRKAGTEAPQIRVAAFIGTSTGIENANGAKTENSSLVVYKTNDDNATDIGTQYDDPAIRSAYTKSGFKLEAAPKPGEDNAATVGSKEPAKAQNATTMTIFNYMYPNATATPMAHMLGALGWPRARSAEIVNEK